MKARIYDMEVRYYAHIDNPGHDLDLDDLTDYIEVGDVDPYDWIVTPRGDGTADLTIKAHVYRAWSKDAAEDAVVDPSRVETEVVEWSYEEVDG